jgi:hypothetical protein
MTSRGLLYGLWALMLVLPGGLLLMPLWLLHRRREMATKQVPVRVTCRDGR